MIWLMAAAQVLTNLDQWYLSLAYAGGYAVGNYVGISIENRFAIGNELIRCISFNRDVLAGKLREEGFKVVSFDGDMGDDHPVELLLIIEKRRNVPSLIRLIKELDKAAVYSVSDVKNVYDGPDLLPRRSLLRSALAPLGKRRCLRIFEMNGAPGFPDLDDLPASIGFLFPAAFFLIARMRQIITLHCIEK